MPKLSEKQRKIVKGKLKGKSNVQLGKELYPEAKHGDILVGRQLKKVSVKQAIEQSLQKHGIVPDSLIEPIADALKAEKVNDVTGEVTKDHSTRLKAAGMGLNLLGVKDKAEGGNSYTFINVAKEDAKEFRNVIDQ